MSDEPSDEELALANKAQVAKVKTSWLKKGLAKEKNILAAKKKDLLAKEMGPPEELGLFLRSEDTYQEILSVAKKDINNILIRRLVFIISSLQNSLSFTVYPVSTRYTLVYISHFSQ